MFVMKQEKSPTICDQTTTAVLITHQDRKKVNRTENNTDHFTISTDDFTPLFL